METIWLFQIFEVSYKKLELEQNVSFVWALNSEQLVERLQQCSMFIQSSFVESYSLALAEAMAIGVPCIVSKAGAMPELVENGRSGMLYNPYCIGELSQSIIHLIQNPQQSSMFSQHALQVGRERNQSERVVETQMKIYNMILNN